MNDAEFKLHGEIEEDHWWFVGKRLILRALFEPEVEQERVLDLGCGTGGILRHWAQRCRCVGIDVSELALEISRRKGVRALARGDLNRLPFRDHSFDTVLALDVLEHLDDDVRFLAGASRVCAPGGRMILSVPAFQLLWSKHDESFLHKRRYTARQLERVVRRAGLIPERTTYTNFWVFPVAAVWRLISYRLGVGRFAPRTDFWKLPRPLNQLLVGIYRLEARMLRRVNLPVGVSAVCVARKPGAPGS